VEKHLGSIIGVPESHRRPLLAGAVELDAEGEADGAAESGPPHEDGALPRDGGSITERKRDKERGRGRADRDRGREREKEKGKRREGGGKGTEATKSTRAGNKAEHEKGEKRDE